MINKIRKNGDTSNIERVKIRRADTGQGLTGLLISSSGLIISTACDNEAAATTYTQAGSTIETISTLATYAAPTATKCRFKEYDATNYPGLYEIQFADARYAVSGAKILRVSISGVANLFECEYTIQLTAIDVNDAVHGGMSALPNTAATTNGSLLTSGVGTDQISASAGKLLLQATQTGVTIPTVTTVGTLTTYTGDTPQTGDSYLKLTDSTFGLSALLTQLRERLPSKIWYVTKAGNDSNVGTKEAPFLTINAALLAMRSFDELIIDVGTYTETVDLDTPNLYGVTIRGTSRKDVIITAAVATYAPVITLEHGVTISNLKVTPSGSDGTGISGVFDKHNITLDRVWCEGKWDGAVVAFGTFNPRGLKILGSYFNATFDGINLGGCQDFICEDSYFRTSGDYGSIFDTSCVRMNTSNTIGHFNRCTFELAHGAGNAGTTKKGTCVLINGTGSEIWLDECKFIGGKSSATDGGNVCGIGPDESAPTAYKVHVIDCDFSSLATSGTGAVYWINKPSGTKVYLRGTPLDSTKLTGTGSIVTDLGSTNGNQVLLPDSSGNVTAGTVSDKTGYALTSAYDAAKTAATQTSVNTGNTALTDGTNGLAAIKTAVVGVPTADQNATTLLDKSLSGHTTSGTAGKALSNADVAVSSVSGGGAPAQVHNNEPDPARTAKLGTRADGVTIAFPTIIVRPGEKTQIWVDCSKYTNVNLGNVANGASSNGTKIAVESVGMYGKFASIVLDETAASDGDVATITCDGTPTGNRLIKVAVSVKCSAN